VEVGGGGFMQGVLKRALQLWKLTQIYSEGITVF
jgi:hypothetical protein